MPYAERLLTFIDAFGVCARCGAGIEFHAVSADTEDRPRAWCLTDPVPGPGDPEYRTEMRRMVQGFGNECRACGGSLESHTLVYSLPSGTPDIWCEDSPNREEGPA